MKNIFTFLILSIILSLTSDLLLAQRESAWEQVSPKIKNRNSFKRMQAFYRQRAFPEDTISYYKFFEIKKNETEKYKADSRFKSTANLVNWVPIGPVGLNSHFPSQWGVVSGRIRAIAIHPTNPDIVYVGAASGGLWKTTNGGTTWSDIGANLESLTFGAIAIDPTNPNTVYAGTGESMYYSNLNTYAGNGIFKSTDGGTTWANISTSFGTRTQFSSVKVSPFNSNVVFATIGRGYWLYDNPGNGGVWRSSNAGVTWTKTLAANDAFEVLPHPTTTNRIYAGVGGGAALSGFYISTNDGISWTKVTTGLPLSTSIGRMQISIARSSPNVIYSIIYRDDLGETQVYKSTNDGANWSQISSSANLGGTYDGSNWNDQGWYDLCIATDPSDPNKVFLGNVELHKTTNGSAFLPVRNTAGPYSGTNAWDSPMHVDYHQIVYAPSNSSVIYVGCDGGVFKSTNGGTTWINKNNGLSTLQLYRVAGSPIFQTMLMGGAQDNGIFATQTGGVGNWDLISTGDGMELFFHPTNPLIAYGSTQNGALYKTTDGGSSLTYISPNVSEGAAWTAPFFMHPTNFNTLYFATDRPYRSTNGGTSWTALTNSTVTGFSTINTMSQSQVNANNMILVGGEYEPSPEIHVSTDGGLTWTEVTANIPGSARYTSRTVFHPTEANTVYVVRSGFGSGKIYKSTNMGANWTNISGNLPDIPHNDLFIDPERTNFLFTANDLGVYLSTNGGTNWTREGNNMPFVPAIDFDYKKIGTNRMLRVGTHGRSIFEVNLNSVIPVELTSFTASVNNGKVQLNWSTATETNNSGFNIERRVSSLTNWEKIGFVGGFGTTAERKNYSYEDSPLSGSYSYRLKQVDLDGTFEYSNEAEVNVLNIKDFELVQNYPNPFNPTTRINYVLPEAGFVKLTVYNALGEKVTGLVNEQKDAGAYEALWNASNLSAGIYFYNIEITSQGKIVYKNSKKMILNK